MAFYHRIVVNGELSEEKVRKIKELGEGLDPKLFETEEERKDFFELKKMAEEEQKKLGLSTNDVKVEYDDHNHETTIEIGYLSTGVLPHQDTCYPLPINQRNSEIVGKIEEVAKSK
jgi:hypothetical protein